MLEQIKKQMLAQIGERRLVLLGYGREGKSTFRFFTKYWPEKKLCILDKNEELSQEAELMNQNAVFGLCLFG